MSKRWEIIQAIVTALSAIAGVGDVTDGPPGIAGLENAELPVITVWWTTDDRLPTSKLGTTNQTLFATVTVLHVDSAASEPWTDLIKAAINADPTLGGLAKTTELVNEAPGYVRPVFERLGIDLNYKIMFRYG